MNFFAELPSITPQQIWDGVVGRVVHGKELTFAVVELAAGAVIPEHSHENEQVGMVVSGSLVFTVDDERRQLEAGGTWSIPPMTPHEVQVGRNGAVVIETFAPPRVDWSIQPRLPRQPPLWPPAAA